MPRRRSNNRPPNLPENLQFQLEIPGAGERPFVSMNFKLATERGANGEQLRLQAHMETRFEALTALPAAQKLKALPGASGARRLVRRGLENRLVQRALKPFEQARFSSWLDLRATTTPRDRGPGELLPGTELAKVGVQPVVNGPPVQTWLSETGGATPGLAQITTLQLDKKDLPARLRRLLGAAPFQLAATVVNVIEDGPSRK